MMFPKRPASHWIVISVAVGVLAAGLWLAPNRTHANLLLLSFFLLTLALGGAVFLALTTVCGARWHRKFTPIPHALARLLPITGLIHLGILAICHSHYDWTPPGHGAETLWFKALWLTPSFWFVRSVMYVVIWSLFAGMLVRGSQAANVGHAAREMRSAVRVSAIFLAVFAVTFSLATVDWLMALEPMWFSTVWGVYGFAGMIEATLAMMIIMGVGPSFRTTSPSLALAPRELHDLAQLLLGFACFWIYIWFCQYMLIWYTNIPEETSYIALRTRTAWGPVVLASILLNWLVPFFYLLPRASKRNPVVMIRVAVIVLLGRWIDLSLIICPAMQGQVPALGVWEFAGIVAVVGIGTTLLPRASRVSTQFTTGAKYIIRT